MKLDLCISIRFIQPLPLFHGRCDAEQPEWPPSPMRAFQALLNAASLRAHGRPLAPDVREAFQTLEVLRPQVIAPRATVSTVGHRAYVPHNQTDLVTAAWHRGNLDASIASHRMEKDFRPMRIETIDDDLPTLHYLYSLDATKLDPDKLLLAIRPAVRAITHLGWGIDQVVADATLIDRSSVQLSGERWLPARTGQRLRVHRGGSLDALMKRHSQFLNRLKEGWTPVSPLTDNDLDQVRYRRDTDPLPRPHAVFKLLDDDFDTTRYPHALLAHIAAVVRHAAIGSMKEGENAPPWIPEAERGPWVNRFVRGKNEPARDDHRQLSYVPLPSIGHQHADAMVRNVMLIAPIGCERELEHVAKRLDGTTLEFKGDAGEACDTDMPPRVMLPRSLQRFTPPSGRFIETCYLGRSMVWQSVTPVILDEHIDKRARETKDGKRIKDRDPEDFKRLIILALQRAGIETPCKFTWQTLPFYKNCLTAHRYDRDKRPNYLPPKRLDGKTAVHVRLMFDHDIPGPITLGAGRHCGFGLFAAVDGNRS